MKRIGIVFCLILAFAAFPAVVRSQAAKPAPTLTEVESLKIQNFSLKYLQIQTSIDQLQQQQASLRAQYQALLKTIEAEYPGYTVEATGNAEPALIEKPKDAPTPTPSKK
jgi:hypothetical protein